MKKWSNPEVWMLGVENTAEEWDTFGNTHEWYCHAKGESVICNDPKQDHADDSSSAEKGHTWTGISCGNKTHERPGNVACCCVGLS